MVSVSRIGGAAIAEALELNTTITRIDLSRTCRVRVVDAERFLVCAPWGVSGNEIGDAGAASIAEALKLNTKITSVNLRGEFPAGLGAPVVCAVVVVVEVVAWLWWWWCWCSGEGVNPGLGS